MGHSLVFMPECHSTNDEASRLLQTRKSSEGTVIVTHHQTAGRGQRSNTWESDPGKNLTFSILLKPHFILAKDQFYLNICISVGLAEYLSEALSETVKIKWPNDILVKDKKLCGILIENHISGQQIQNSIVGIGLNVNQEKFVIEKAGSMKQMTGREFVLEVELQKLLEKIESRYLLLREGQTQKLFSDYLSQMYWLREKHVFSTFQKELEGIIIGVDEIGRLLIEMEDGVEVFGVKEVEFLR